MFAESRGGSELDVRHYLDILLRRRWIVAAITGICVVSTTLFVFTRRPVYRAQTLLVIEKEQMGGSVFAEGALIDRSADDYYQTQYKLLKSHSLLEKVHNELELGAREEFEGPDGLAKLEKAVTIAPVRRSRLVHVQAESQDPILAVKIADSLAQSFVRQNLSNLLFISKDVLKTLQTNPDSTEGKLAYESLPAVVNNALIQTLKTDRMKLESRLADLSKRYTKRHPEMLALRSNLDTVKRQIQAETDKVVQSVKTELSGKLKGNNVRIVDRARLPKYPFKPRKKRAVGLALLAGGFLGFLCALLVESLDQTIRTPEDVQAKLQMPSLGLIPYAPVPSRESVYRALNSPKLSLTSEAFRNLRTMVDLAGVSDKSQTFLVTSTIQEEGKSYVATNLAVACSQIGQSVLLIDGDLRRPSLHKNFRLSSQHGLSEFLASGSDVSELEALIQKTDTPGLKLLVCGPKPPNPSELLNTPRVAALLGWAKASFDRVIVDCPPNFPIHDTLLWGRHVPRAIFVVRYGETRAPLVASAAKSLTEGGMKILGVTVNAAKASGLTYSGYGYGYYQQYYHHPEQPKAARST